MHALSPHEGPVESFFNFISISFSVLWSSSFRPPVTRYTSNLQDQTSKKSMAKSKPLT